MAPSGSLQWIIGASDLIHALSGLLSDATRFVVLALRSRAALTAENLFLRKTKPRRADDATRLVLALLSKLFAWRDALIVVKPGTLIGWHRKGFRLFWKWKSKPRGRPQVPREVRTLIAAMANENPTWGEERIAAELLLKLGIRVSPRTVRRYLPDDPGPDRASRLNVGRPLFAIMRKPFSPAISSSPWRRAFGSSTSS